LGTDKSFTIRQGADANKILENKTISDYVLHLIVNQAEKNNRGLSMNFKAK